MTLPLSWWLEVSHLWLLSEQLPPSLLAQQSTTMLRKYAESTQRGWRRFVMHWLSLPREGNNLTLTDRRKKSFTVRTTIHWYNLPKDAVESSSVEISKWPSPRVLDNRLSFPQKVGPDGFSRYLPTWAVLWFCNNSEYELLKIQSRWSHFMGLCFSFGLDQKYLWTHCSLVKQAKEMLESPRSWHLFPRQQQPGLCKSWPFCSMPAPSPMQNSSSSRDRDDISRAEDLFSSLIVRLDTGSLAYPCAQEVWLDSLHQHLHTLASLLTQSSYYYVTVPVRKRPSVGHLRLWQEAVCWRRDCCSLLCMTCVWQTAPYLPGDFAICHCDDMCLLYHWKGNLSVFVRVWIKQALFQQLLNPDKLWARWI